MHTARQHTFVIFMHNGWETTSMSRKHDLIKCMCFPQWFCLSWWPYVHLLMSVCQFVWMDGVCLSACPIWYLFRARASVYTATRVYCFHCNPICLWRPLLWLIFLHVCGCCEYFVLYRHHYSMRAYPCHNRKAHTFVYIHSRPRISKTFFHGTIQMTHTLTHTRARAHPYMRSYNLHVPSAVVCRPRSSMGRRILRNM